MTKKNTKQYATDLVDQWITMGYALFEYPDELQRFIDDAQESWRRVVSHKNYAAILAQFFLFKNDKGFEYKLGDVDSGDMKSNFYTAPDVFLEFQESLKGKMLPADLVEDVLNFLNSTNKLHAGISQLLGPFMADLELLTEKKGLVDALKCNLPVCPIRSLWYHPGGAVGKPIANQHLDVGLFTLTLVESCEGFEFFSQVSRKWIRLRFKKGQFLCIPGLQMQHVSGGQIKALPHRVMGTIESVEFGRISQVMFTDLPREFVNGYNRERFGPTSKLGGPGWNFEISQEKFDLFFD